VEGEGQGLSGETIGMRIIRIKEFTVCPRVVNGPAGLHVNCKCTGGAGIVANCLVGLDNLARAYYIIPMPNVRCGRMGRSTSCLMREDEVEDIALPSEDLIAMANYLSLSGQA